ncbi:glycosyltransferase family 4 protein [Luteibacter aegosomaticola]|uniref:glycosyltransferase family 4 protein n=1 Tax=Luteibacter aegosomaticola TaxID=2911538 RepID=UPI001FFACAEC|nr:glycosyltransferase family 4 protein [Luteibacter aegosomaticola]UPG90949.1 glycosyltransferase family 4 protein [Luteibacter aegosomaticola]
MKLGIILPGGVDRSGEERVIPAFLALIERLAREHEVHVFVFHQEPEPARWMLRGAHIHNIGDHWPSAPGRSALARDQPPRWRRPTGWLRLRTTLAILKEHRTAPFNAMQSLFSGTCGQVAAIAGTLLRIPYHVHIAGGELVALNDIGYGGRRRVRSRVSEAAVLRGAGGVTAASTPILESLHKLGIHATRIPLGVDLDRWRPLAPRPRTQDAIKLIHVASLNPVKDQTTLLHALALLKGKGVRFDMTVVGVDTLNGRIQRLAEDLGLAACVHFIGFRTQSALRPLLADADLLVMSSRHEAGPLVLLEAAVLGVPSVGTAVGHYVEWAPHAALTAPPGDAHALADAIARIAHDEPLRQRLATAAHYRAQTEDADATAAAFIRQYASPRPQKAATTNADLL